MVTLTEREKKNLRFYRYVKFLHEANEADNKKIIWLLRQCEEIKNIYGFSKLSAILNHIEDVLYPEYDGELVKMTSWGWETPEGNIIYNKEKYEHEYRENKNGNTTTTINKSR